MTYFEQVDQACQIAYEAMKQDGVEITVENLKTYVAPEMTSFCEAWLEHHQDEKLEEWQLQAVQNLLTAGNLAKMESGRYILESNNDRRKYHVLSKAYSLQIEQIEEGEKWSKRVTFEGDQIVALTRALVQMYLEERKPKPTNNIEDENFLNETLGDLDDHPF